MKRIGCSGWFYWHWKSRFYPDTIPQSKWFSYYAEQFDTVELNSTFYRFPKISTAKSWYRQAPAGFVYTLKANRSITHVKKFKNTKKLVKNFYALIDELKEKAGCVLFQLPPSMKFDMKKLEDIIGQMNTEKRNVIEFRHKTWFCGEVYDKLKENNIMFCSVSSPSLPETLVKTARGVYIRFHGKGGWYKGNYTEKELAEWAAKIKKSRAKEVWAYFNNDYNAYAPKNAITLKKFL